ncbi:MAG: RDD family protein [Flavobacteriales bacterium]
MVTSQNVTIEYQLASIGERLVALLIDYIILLAYYLIMYNLVTNTRVNTYEQVENLDAIAKLLILPVIFFYHLAFEVFCAGQSIGKMALSIRVVNLHGQNPTLSECFLRWAFRPIEIALTVGALASIYVSSSEKSQRLGDLVARTVVVKLNKNNRHTLKEVMNIKSKENYQPIYTQVTRYTDEEMLYVKICLERVRRYPNTENKKLMNELSLKVCDQLSITPVTDKRKQADFLKQVLQDYIVITRS